MMRNYSDLQFTTPAFLNPAARGSARHARKILLEVSEHVAEMKELSLESMSVVLKPDAHTQFSLELSQNDGAIEIRTQCDRGDFCGLRAHWAELQKLFAAQEVRLEDLESARRSPPERDAENTDTEEVLAATLRKPRSHRWEWWA